MPQLTLQPITAENWRRALELAVHEEQQPFVSEVTPPVAIALAKAYVKPGGMMVEPYGVCHEEGMVGFLNLHYIPRSAEDYWLLHFFIDKRFQRKGFGSAAIEALIDYLKRSHPACRRLRLSVHPDNETGKRFYKKLGFIDDQILTYGEPTYSKFM